MWGTCVDLSPEYLYVCSSLAEVESTTAAKSRLRVYKRVILHLLMCNCFTNTHGKVVVVRQNVCENLSERSRSNPKPDSFRLGGESLCGVNLTSLPYMGFNSRIDFRCETNSPKTLRRASSTPSYSPRG